MLARAVLLLVAASALFANLDKAIALYRDRQFAAAESELRRILAKDSKNAHARLLLARTLIETGKLPEALGELDRALSLGPDAEVQFQAGRIVRELAERRFMDLENVAPDSAALREMAGRRSELSGSLAEALHSYRAAAKMDPRRPGVHFLAGNVLWRMRELDAAESELKAELAISPSHGMASFRLGQIMLSRDDNGAALPYLEKAVAAMPANLEAHRELGKVYRKSGRTADARREWELVAKARPGDDQIHYLLAGLYRELGETALAQEELARHRTILERRRTMAGKP